MGVKKSRELKIRNIWENQRNENGIIRNVIAEGAI